MALLPADKAFVLVEGIDDVSVVRSLCEIHGIVLDVQDSSGRILRTGDPVTGGGFSLLLSRVAARLKEPGNSTLGIVVDADQHTGARWGQLRDRIRKNGYATVPKSPPRDGWISSESNLRRVGIWIMPDNNSTGMLEDFVLSLLPDDEPLRMKAEAVLSEIEREAINRYNLNHRSKVLVHTWLAWQKRPGQSIGLALRTTKDFRRDAPPVLAFVAWLRRLFDLDAAPEVA